MKNPALKQGRLQTITLAPAWPRHQPEPLGVCWKRVPEGSGVRIWEIC